jgi:proline iminopeptidase
VVDVAAEDFPENLMRAKPALAGMVALAAIAGVASAARRPLVYPAVIDLPTSEQFVRGAGGARLFCRVVGSAKESILFLHGGPGLGIEDGGLDLERIAADGFRFIECDQRGGARSTLVSRAELGLDEYVRDLEAVRRYFKLDRLNLIGLSWGSAIAARYAADHPGLVRRVVFLSPMPPTEELDRRRTEHMESLLTKAEREEEAAAGKQMATANDQEIAGVCRKFFSFSDRLYVADPAHLLRARGDICSYSPGAIRAASITDDVSIASLGHWNWRSLLAGIQAPALVIEGERSNVPLEGAKTWAEWLPNAKLSLIPAAGHQSWLDAPDAVEQAIVSFFRP